MIRFFGIICNNCAANKKSKLKYYHLLSKTITTSTSSRLLKESKAVSSLLKPKRTISYSKLITNDSNNINNKTKENLKTSLSFLLCSFIVLISNNNTNISSIIENDDNNNKYNKKNNINEQSMIKKIKEHEQEKDKKNYIISTNFMYKLSKKAYLNHDINATNHVLSNYYPHYHYFWNRNNNNSSSIIMNKSTTTTLKGIPKSLRLLIIDIDDFGYEPIPYNNINDDYDNNNNVEQEEENKDNNKNNNIYIFDKKVKLQSNHMYLDGIARPKRIIKKSSISRSMKVEQKSLITSYAKAGDNVDMLYASIKRLNPLGITKKKNKKTYKYLKLKHNKKEKTKTANDDSDDNVIIDDEEEEAPWNQEAWLDELKLRLNGRIKFTSSTECSSFVSYYLFGTIYKCTIPYDGRNILSRFLFKSSGIDGDNDNNNNNPASNKPHAVLANGNAMSCMPGSLYHLSKYCKEANVPLYIIHDPRQYYNKKNTTNNNNNSIYNNDLYSIIVDMKKNIKDKIIYNVFKIKQQQHTYSYKRFFEFGRKLGYIEGKVSSSIMQWKSKRATVKGNHYVVKEDNKKTSSFTTTDASWKKYTTKKLLGEFISKGIITVNNNNNDKNVNDSINKIYTCTKSLQEIYDLCSCNKNNDPTVDINNNTNSSTLSGINKK